MILVVGGSFQGKKAYVEEHFHILSQDITDGAECSMEAIYKAKVVNHFHDYLRRLMNVKDCSGENENGILPKELTENIMRENPQVIIIANEMGSGVVPVDRFDRDFREYAGRVCCEIAKNSREVHRVICGIGSVIKHA